MDNLFKNVNKRESAVDIVINNIKELIVERKLKPGDKLPTEIEITNGLGVSRGSVREAMKILSAFGLIDIRVGNGTYICDSVSNTAIDSFLFSFYLTNPNLNNIYELRFYYEIDIMQMIDNHYAENEATRNAMRENIAELEILVKNGVTGEPLSQKDIEFHQLMGKATNNILAERIYNFIVDFMQASIKATHKNQDGGYILDAHKLIMDTIEKRNTKHIPEAIEFSLRIWKDLQPENLQDSIL